MATLHRNEKEVGIEIILEGADHLPHELFPRII
jgi:hypothetical protein